MAKKKLLRFSEIAKFPNVIEVKQFSEKVEDIPMKGHWGKFFFKNERPLVLELGCGKGEYTFGLGQANLDKNFIGADLKGNRIWVGAKKALDNNLQNIGFLRTRIENIDKCFASGEVNEIWITFPDPQPQKSRVRKRLTHPEFLSLYSKILSKSGIIHLKTDSTLLFEFTMDVINEHKHELIYATSDLYSDTNPYLEEVKSIKTYYEKLFSEKGFKINYLKFRLKE